MYHFPNRWLLCVCLTRSQIICTTPYSIIFCPGYFYSWYVNKVCGIALAWDKPKPKRKNKCRRLHTRLLRGRGGRVATRSLTVTRVKCIEWSTCSSFICTIPRALIIICKWLSIVYHSLYFGCFWLAFFQLTTFQNRNVSINNTIEIKYSRDSYWS